MKTPRQRKAKIFVNGKKDMYVRENFKRLQEGNDRMNLIILRSVSLTVIYQICLWGYRCKRKNRRYIFFVQNGPLNLIGLPYDDLVDRSYIIWSSYWFEIYCKLFSLGFWYTLNAYEKLMKIIIIEWNNLN